MAEIIQTTPERGTGRKSRRYSVQPDMTPMVDLAFLLVTFFVLTTSMMKTRAIPIIYPSEEGDPTQANHVLNILLEDSTGRIFWYYGMLKPGITELNQTDFSGNGLRKILLEHNPHVLNSLQQIESAMPPRESWTEADYSQFQRLSNEVFASKNALTVLVKTLPETKYEAVITAMDELNICHVHKRAVQDMNKEEIELIKNQ